MFCRLLCCLIWVEIWAYSAAEIVNTTNKMLKRMRRWIMLHQNIWFFASANSSACWKDKVLLLSWVIRWVVSSIWTLSVLFQAAEIERRIVQETEAEKHIQKLLLLGKCLLASHYLCCLCIINEESTCLYLNVENSISNFRGEIHQFYHLCFRAFFLWFWFVNLVFG